MSGTNKIAVSELSSDKYKNLKGEAYLNAVEEEMLDANEGAADELNESEEASEMPKVTNIGK